MSYEVTTRYLDYESLVREADPDLDKPDAEYTFSNGREFERPNPPPFAS